MHSYVLQADGLCCERGDRTLFKALSFKLLTGDVLKLQGANGTGKTSLLRILAGLLSAQEGHVLWSGEPISQHISSYCAQLHYIGHTSGIKRDLTVYESLSLMQTLCGNTQGTVLDAAKKLQLESLLERSFDALSAGQKRRVALAKLVLCHKPLWLLDEPFTAMDAEGIVLVQHLLTQHAKQGGISVVSTLGFLRLKVVIVW